MDHTSQRGGQHNREVHVTVQVGIGNSSGVHLYLLHAWPIQHFPGWQSFHSLFKMISTINHYHLSSGLGTAYVGSHAFG